MSEPRFCAIIPTFDNPDTVRAVVQHVRGHLSHVLVVDDGSNQAAHDVLTEVAEAGLAEVVRRGTNGGKGAAARDGFRRAGELGFTHAVLIDADGQHDTGDIPKLVETARRTPDALVCGQPIFDASAPRTRLAARQLSIFWCHVECGGRVIADPLFGFRVYPLEATLAVGPFGDHMDFDPEIAVRLYWAGTPVVNVPTRVRYLSADEGGISHFRLFRDNVRISLMHTRLMMEKTRRGAGRHLPWMQK